MNTHERHGTRPYITVSHNGFDFHYTPQGDDWYAVEVCLTAALEHASRLASGQVEYVTSELCDDLIAAGTFHMSSEWFMDRGRYDYTTPGDVEVVFAGTPPTPAYWGR